MKNYYTRLTIIILIVLGLAQFIPEAVNLLLALVLASMVVMNAGQFVKLLSALKL